VPFDGLFRICAEDEASAPKRQNRYFLLADIYFYFLSLEWL